MLGNKTIFHNDISIHALHEESDLTDCQHCHKPIFQSTLSMRRATDKVSNELRELWISIHALHEESDYELADIQGNRRISIHALHEESDSAIPGLPMRYFDFNPRSP